MAIQPSHHILVVEDSDDDFEATRRAFDKAGLANPIDRCSDGDEALDYLNCEGDYADRDPDTELGIILLDLNLPGTDGREVLEAVKGSTSTRDIPVIVLTTSNDKKDIDACYALGANSYMQKPVDLHGFMEAIVRLKEYWFEVVVLPRS
jgi:CheY-like chemotaxis protein